MLPLSGAKLLQLKNTSEVFLHICKTGAWQFIQFFSNKKIASCCWHLFFPNKLSWSELSETKSWEILSERVHQSRRAAGPHPLIPIVPSAFPNSTNRSLQNWPNSSFRILGRTASSWRRKKPSKGSFLHIHHGLTSPLKSSPLESSLAAVEKVKPLIIHQFSQSSSWQQSPCPSVEPSIHSLEAWSNWKKFCCRGFFSQAKIWKTMQLRQNGKKSEPQTFWGKKMEKNIWNPTTQFYPSRLKQHQKWHELIRPQTIRGAEVLQCLHGSHHLRHVGAETNQWCLLHPSQAPVGELGLTCTKSEKNISGNDHMGPTFHGKFGISSTQTYLEWGYVICYVPRRVFWCILISHAKVHNTHLILLSTSQMKSSKFHMNLQVQVEVDDLFFI